MTKISTKNVGSKSPVGNTKRDKQLALQRHHDELFKRERVNNPKFIPRMCYSYKDDLVFGLYPKEIYGTKDIYIEFCNRDYVAEDSQRTLWKWIFNPEYKTEYARGEPHPTTGDQMYFIPVDELVNITRYHDADKKQADEFKPLLDLTPKPKVVEKPKEVVQEEKKAPAVLTGTPVDTMDMPYSQMTLLDYMAIHTAIPCSKKQWINDLITKHRK